MGFSAVAAPAVAEGASKGAEAAGAGLLGSADALAPAAAISLPEITVTGGAEAAGLGAGEAASLGGATAAGAASAAGGGVLDGLLGATNALPSFSDLFSTPAAAGELSPNAIVSGEFDQVNNGIAGGVIDQQGASAPASFAPPSQVSAATAAAPPGVSPSLPADPTAASTAGGGGGSFTPTPTDAPAAANPTPPANVPGGATTPAAAKDSAFSLDNLIKGAGNSIMKNPLGVAISGGGLLYSVMNANQISSAQKSLEEQAAGLNAQGQQMAHYLTSGTLPPGLKKALDQATFSAKEKVVSNYAAQGMNTDPSQNSALAQQLRLIDQQAIITTAQVGQQLFQGGVQESGLASSIYSQLVSIDQSQNALVGQAIANMAQALSPSKLSINLGK